MTDTANEELLNRVIRHQVYLERFKASELPKLIAQLNALDADLIDQLHRMDPATLGGRRMVDMIDKVAQISDEATKRYAAALDGSLMGLGKYETSWTSANIAQAMGAEILVKAGLEIVTPDPNLLKAAIYSRPLQGRLLKDWVAGLGDARKSRLAAAIRIAMIEQQTIGQLVTRIIGTKANDYRDGILEISRRGAAILARTATQHVSNEARRLSYDQNSDVVSEVQWVATLDGRTTPYCRAMDGKRFALDSGPRPPAHIGCRSTTVPVLKSWADIGIDAGDISEGTRASMNGQVPDTLTYDAWLRKQTPDLQDEILGRAKADLFRNGLTMDKFVDLNTQHEFTLDELRQREPEIWSAAHGGKTAKAGRPSGLAEGPAGTGPAMPESFNKHGRLQQIADAADEGLAADPTAADAAKAVEGFIGHGPGARVVSGASGIMDAAPLENALGNPASAVATQLERHFAPVREQIRVELGNDTVRLFRVQGKVEPRDAKVIYMSRGKADVRNVLSWTSDREFAEQWAGVPKKAPRALYTDAERIAFEKELAAKGEVTIGSTRLVPNPDAPQYLDMYDRHGEYITDTDSVAHYIAGRNEALTESRAYYDRKMANVFEANVPLDAVRWVSDRAGQSEFIVRNELGAPWHIDARGRLGGSALHDLTAPHLLMTEEQANRAMGSLAPDENGLNVGIREIIGSGSKLPLALGDHGSFAKGEAAIRRYMTAASEDLHNPALPGAYEHMTAIEVDTGKVLFRTTDNERSSVQVPGALMDSYVNPGALPVKGIDIWHNHPSAMSPLSTQDMVFTMHLPAVRNIVAQDALGNVFRGEAPHFASTVDRDSHLNWLHYGHRQWMTEFKNAIPEFDELTPIFRTLQAGDAPGKLSIMQGYHGYGNHLSWRLMDELGFLKYTHETTGTLAELDRIFNQVLAEEGMTLLDFAREAFNPKTVAAQLRFAADTKRLYL